MQDTHDNVQPWSIIFCIFLGLHVLGSVHETRAKYVTFVGNRKHDNAWIVVGVSISKGAVQRTVIRVHVLKGKRVSSQACQKFVICQSV